MHLNQIAPNYANERNLKWKSIYWPAQHMKSKCIQKNIYMSANNKTRTQEEGI
jgi:hypothetical protein